jgi:hypothetical protein
VAGWQPYSQPASAWPAKATPRQGGSHQIYRRLHLDIPRRFNHPLPYFHRLLHHTSRILSACQLLVPISPHTSISPHNGTSFIFAPWPIHSYLELHQPLLARSCPSLKHLSPVPALPLHFPKSHSLASADFVLVFSPRRLSGRRLTRGRQHDRSANLIADPPRRPQDGHSSQGCCRPCGSRCECASNLHSLRRCRWEQ